MTLSGTERGARLRDAARPRVEGRVERVGQYEVEIAGLPVGLGDLVVLGAERPIEAEVVAVDRDRATVLAFGPLRGRRVGEPAKVTGRTPGVPTGGQLLGRILDGLGQPIDDGPPLDEASTAPLHDEPPSALSRPRITRPMPVGVRAIDTFLTCGRGQRIAILAGSGVGKSSLLSMLIRGSEADVNVLCLVGERGREVREFLDNDLGPDGLSSSVVVVATSDQPALVRRNAAYVATTIGERFRDDGLHVNLLMDSVTRFALAQRDIGLAAGELPTTRGYPPSSLGSLPTLLERAGTAASGGSITGFYTVLVEADDLHDPVGDTVRSIVDGHVVLSRDLANAGHFPSIDVLASSSRVAPSVTTPEQRALAADGRRLLAVHDRARDLIEVGAYVPGSDPEVDRAVAVAPALDAFRRQDLREISSFPESWQRLAAVVGQPGEAAIA